MKRIAISDGSGSWFDLEKSEKFEEETWYDGQNNVSRATGIRHNHESLYLTSSKKWVLNKYSQYANQSESYEVISENEAVVWFLKQEMDLPEQLEGLDRIFEI